MSIPTDEELESCRDTLEWLVENCRQLEPHAVNTIAAWEEAAQAIPSEDELEDHE